MSRLSQSGGERTASRIRKRILVVNCYLDETRRRVGRTAKVPQAMGPAYLAGAFKPDRCQVRLYSELYSGPLEDEELLAWPDMLVLTSLTAWLDRMRQLTAYARTKNSKVIVVAGGPSVRAFPLYASRFFDYCCQGDVEELREVVIEALGADFASQEMVPRFDLVYWNGPLAYIETSRYCNFRCSFCSLTGEGRNYQSYDLEAIRNQILATAPRRKPSRKLLMLLDNNFYGNSRKDFLGRIGLLKELRQQGHFRAWSGLVTNDFFLKDDNLRLAKESGCGALFSGVESFDAQWLRKAKKLQNVQAPQVDLIRKCLQAGIVFLYGLILDVYTRRVESLRQELEFIVARPEITLPSFLTVAIPIPGTPFFRQCLEEGRFLPSTKLRDLDGTTVSMRPLDSVEEAARFLRGVQTLRGFKLRALRHAALFMRRYACVLDLPQTILALRSIAYLCEPGLATAPGWMGRLSRSRPRTYISTTEPLDTVYTPSFRVDSRYQSYFQPTMLTDEGGRLAEDLAEDLSSSGPPAEGLTPLK